MADESGEISDQLLTILGVGSGVMQLAVFTWVGVMLFDNAVYGVAVGVFSGVGAFLFVPWLLSYSAAQEAASPEPAGERIARSTGPGVFGLGLELGAITMLALGFVQEPPALLLGVASALVVGVGVYLLGSFVLEA
ncbi:MULTISPECIES: hypothetical protein [Halolamina]|uniref:Uncharacterized protein n=1 Tax=Halolamina pelagica TaxID=699431 RepID=A0A1I5NPJ2_9EURY|nr:MULTISPECIES: hypothetical protein [Halolamina]NHX36418.1 hypothetical protein [Halolamina sp. R1-12]SFP23735.1 hypothetical protein SAMN05216277_102134 [Halolamina pelagica]